MITLLLLTMTTITETLHGTQVTDPYRWLEDSKSPAVISWTESQNTKTRTILDSLPARPALESRLRNLMQSTTTSAPGMEGSHYFYRQRQGAQNQAVLYVRDTPTGPSRLLLDPNTLDKDGLITLSWYTPSQDGNLLAYGLYRSGDENSVCHILNVQTLEKFPDQIPGKVSELHWDPDHKGFFYRRLQDIKNPYSGQIRHHTLGAQPDADPILFEQYKTGPLATTWGPFATVSRDARWMALGYYTSTKSNDLSLIDLDAWRAGKGFLPISLFKDIDAKFDPTFYQDTLYIRTTQNAPNGKLLSIDPNHPDQIRQVVAEQADATIQDLQVAKDTLVVSYMKKAYNSIALYDLDGTHPRPLDLPGIGSASVNTHPDRTESFLYFTSYNIPPTIYHLDLTTGQRTLWNRQDVPIDPDLVTVDQVTYPSKDKTPITMFIIHRKDLKLDGTTPFILTGYGGFGIGMTPHFDATMFPWFEAGGAYAIPNLRGGGEYGESWHESGMLAKKQNVFDDFISAGEYLVAHNYTVPSKLGIAGGSNGGLLTGACLVQRPDLFGAVISAVPLLDMLRYQKFLMAKYWVPEYGSSEDASQFPYLLKYSPYHNIHDGTKYPAVFLTAGENDSRVHPMHARKMAARLQAATSSDKPILLWVEREAGHGQGKPLSLRLREVTDERLFMMWQLGVVSPPPAPYKDH